PASISWRNTFGSRLAGPMVQTIFVRSIKSPLRKDEMKKVKNDLARRNKSFLLRSASRRYFIIGGQERVEIGRRKAVVNLVWCMLFYRP
ncbi:hypothetical protein RZS08_06265, partial [Arthrospira platensis SPKY1]|nr:hypothetical protein [Arthrospira platensis SPKY1]